MASGGHDLATMAGGIGAELKARKETIAVAESSAGGLISAALLAVPGASAYFLGGGVIYTQAARPGLLRVPDETVKGIRSSTEAYALLKARTSPRLLGAPVGLAEAGASRLAALGLPHQCTTAQPAKPTANRVFLATRWPLTRIRLYSRCDEAARLMLVAAIEAPEPVTLGVMHVPNRVTGRKDAFFAATLSL